MSVREKPNVSRFLDLDEKELHYRTHVMHVKKSKASIDTKRPELPPRLRVMNRNNTLYREKQIKYGKVHNKLLSDVRRPKKNLTDFSQSVSFFTQQRSSTSSLQKRPVKTSEMELFKRQYNLTKQQTRQSFPTPKRESLRSTEQIAAASLRDSSDDNDAIKIGTVDHQDKEMVFVEQKRTKTKKILSSESSSESSSDDEE